MDKLPTAFEISAQIFQGARCGCDVQSWWEYGNFLYARFTAINISSNSRFYESRDNAVYVKDVAPAEQIKRQLETCKTLLWGARMRHLIGNLKRTTFIRLVTFMVIWILSGRNCEKAQVMDNSNIRFSFPRDDDAAEDSEPVDESNGLWSSWDSCPDLKIVNLSGTGLLLNVKSLVRKPKQHLNSLSLSCFMDRVPLVMIMDACSAVSTLESLNADSIIPTANDLDKVVESNKILCCVEIGVRTAYTTSVQELSLSVCDMVRCFLCAPSLQVLYIYNNSSRGCFQEFNAATCLSLLKLGKSVVFNIRAGALSFRSLDLNFRIYRHPYRQYFLQYKYC